MALKASRIVLALAVVAALRTLFFCAAFPFFNNVDEQAHFDVVSKYSRGEVPRGLGRYGRESAIDIVLYGSPEFLQPPDAPTRPPLWTDNLKYDPAVLEKRLGVWKDSPNHEATQPPVYYALAGAWLAAGRGLGLGEGAQLYWIRFLNALVAAALVGVGYALAAELYPKNNFLKLGVPALLAFLPQDVFYSISNDVLSPLWGAAAFYGVIRFRRKRSGLWPWAAGLACAAAVLTVFSNAPILILLAPLGLLASAALAPIALWAARNHFVLGDLTGSAEKIRFLGWTWKAPALWFHHPIFGPKGFAFFLERSLATFWRGEIVWKRAELFPKAFDYWFAASSLVFVVWGSLGKDKREARLLSLSWIVLELAFLAWMSIAFNFTALIYPSAAEPFVTSGRLMLSALVPFLILYLQGLEAALGAIGRPALKWPVLLLILAAISSVEVGIAAKVLGSPYNAFHLP